jgi:hypothetical protein
MPIDELKAGLKDRLDDFIKRAQSGKSVQLEIKTHRDVVKHVVRSESTDDIDVETVMSLLMADFKMVPAAEGDPKMVSKVYAVGTLNASEPDAKTTAHVANQRLRMDYARLKEADITFEETFF